MTTDSSTYEAYEPPTLEVVGTLQELTRSGNLFPSDDGINLNTAQPIPPPPTS